MVSAKRCSKGGLGETAQGAVIDSVAEAGNTLATNQQAQVRGGSPVSQTGQSLSEGAKVAGSATIVGGIVTQVVGPMTAGVLASTSTQLLSSIAIGTVVVTVITGGTGAGVALVKAVSPIQPPTITTSLTPTATRSLGAGVPTISCHATSTPLPLTPTPLPITPTLGPTSTQPPPTLPPATATPFPLCPYCSPGERSRLAVSDPLHNNAYGYNWDVNTSCKLKPDGYHLTSIADAKTFCSGDYVTASNFVMEVQVTSLFPNNTPTTNYVGIDFSVQSTTLAYSFITRPNQNGLYVFSAGMIYTYGTYGQITPPTSLSPYLSYPGNFSFTMAVKIKGNVFSLYVDHHVVFSTSLTSPPYFQSFQVQHSGKIGFFADALTSGEWKFNNVTIWTLT